MGHKYRQTYRNQEVRRITGEAKGTHTHTHTHTHGAVPERQAQLCGTVGSPGNVLAARCKGWHDTKR